MTHETNILGDSELRQHKPLHSSQRTIFARQVDESLWQNFLSARQALYDFTAWPGKGITSSNLERGTLDQDAVVATRTLAKTAINLNRRFLEVHEAFRPASSDLIHDARAFIHSVTKRIPLGVPVHNEEENI